MRDGELDRGCDVGSEAYALPAEADALSISLTEARGLFVAAIAEAVGCSWLY